MDELDAIRAETEQKYADIINRERPGDEEFFRRHPRMPLEERAKIFAPFAALHHADRLAEEDAKLTLRERPVLSEDRAEELSRQLNRLRPGMEITVSFFVPDGEEPGWGHSRESSGRVRAVSTLRRCLQIGEREIPFDDLIELGLPDDPGPS